MCTIKHENGALCPSPGLCPYVPVWYPHAWRRLQSICAPWMFQCMDQKVKKVLRGLPNGPKYLHNHPKCLKFTFGKMHFGTPVSIPKRPIFKHRKPGSANPIAIQGNSLQGEFATGNRIFRTAPPPPCDHYLWFAFVCFLIRSHPPPCEVLAWMAGALSADVVSGLFNDT